MSDWVGAYQRSNHPQGCLHKDISTVMCQISVLHFKFLNVLSRFSGWADQRCFNSIYMFLKENLLYSPRLHLFAKKYTGKIILWKYYCNLKLYTVNFFCGKCDVLHDSLMNRKSRRTAFIEIKIFCNIIIVFSVTFELCNASLLNKIINFILIFLFFNLTYSKLLNGITGYTTILSSAIVVIIANNKKINILELFLKVHVTRIMAAENSAL